MKSLYVVRNSFKAHGTLYGVGVVIDNPSSIWTFRSRLGVRDVIELTEGGRDNEMWFAYLQARALSPLDERILEICGKTKLATPKVEALVQTPVTHTVKAAPVVKKPLAGTKPVPAKTAVVTGK